MTTQPPKIYGVALGLIIALASYLSWAHGTAMPVACPTTGLMDCSTVLTGPGSLLLGLPLSAWGGLWAIGGWIGPAWSPRLRGLWMLAGVAGLLWTGIYEGLDRYLSLWCSGMQLLVLVALGALIPWSVIVSRGRRGWRTLSRRAWIGGSAAGVLSSASVVGYQAWLGTNTWGVVGLLAGLWGVTSAWLVALLVSRPRWGRAATAGTIGLTAPITLAAGLGTTACAAGVCAGGLSAATVVGSVGFGGMLASLFGVFAPMALQGMVGLVGLGVAGYWTVRRGGR